MKFVHSDVQWTYSYRNSPFDEGDEDDDDGIGICVASNVALSQSHHSSVMLPPLLLQKQHLIGSDTVVLTYSLKKQR